MPTYSTNLALNLPNDGEYSGTWGQITNNNLGTLVEQAISGYVQQNITDGADTVITIPLGATGVARNMYIEAPNTNTLTATRNLIVPNNKKLYFFFNNTAGGQSVTVKVSGQVGVTVPNGAKAALVCNGTDIILAANFFDVVDINGGTIDSTPIGLTTPSTGAFTTVTVSGSTIPVNGMYLPAANTVAISTNSVQRWKVDGNGLHTFTAPANDTTNFITLNTRGSMINFARSSDGGLAGFIGSRTGSSNFSFYNQGGVSSEIELGPGTLNLYTNTLPRVAITTGGNITINAPTSGNVLTVSGNASGTFSWTSAATSGYNVASATNDTGFLLGHNSALRTFELQTNSTSRIVISGVGNVTIAVPTNGQTLTVAPSPAAGELIASSSALTSGAGASTGTLTNAPSAGNPTKWIKINDNGTIRSVPAW